MRSIKKEDKIKTNIILPYDVVIAIDKIIKKRKRNQFIVEAIREKIEKVNLKRALEKAAGCWRDEDHPELKNQKDINKYLKEIRVVTNRRIWRLLKNEKLSP
jgi:hypothetical protein